MKVAVVMGGYSGECGISLKSGQLILSNLDRNKYEVFEVHILSEGWFLIENQKKYPVSRGDFSAEKNEQKITFDVIVNIIHGTPGEDGLLQAYWKLIGIPFTGCDFYQSALTFNKRDTLSVLAKFGVPKAQSVYASKSDVLDKSKIIKELGLPLFVKANRSGSSLGVSKVNQEEEFDMTTDEISFVPEQVFRETNIQNEKVLQLVNEQVDVTAEAVAFKVDGEVVTYLENQDKVNELIKTLKLQYVSEEDLEKLEARKQSGEELPPLAEGESRILDVYLSKNVTISLEEVKPDEVLPIDQALQLLKKGTLKEEKYVIQEGDVLGSIAEKHGLKLKQLLELNPDYTEDTILQIGDELNVTVYKPFVDVIVEKEISSIEEIPYETKTVEDSSMFKGDTKVVQSGSKGEKAVSYRISQVNGSEVNREVLEEKVLKEPVERIVHKGTKVVPSRGTGSLVWPTNGGYISSYQGMRWGRYHKGIDIARPWDYTIKAADNGVVVSAGWAGSYGNRIIIDHQNGMRTLYAHLSQINVSVGQTVAAGQKIGVMGSTGNSTGVHLHFEVYKNGVLQNPLSYY